MDNIIGEEVFHKIFGTGIAVAKEKEIVSVQFGGNVRKVLYPDIFKQFLTTISLKYTST